MSFAIQIADVLSAAEQLKGAAVRTPLLEFDTLNERVGRRVMVKFEGAQHTGSFKFRGAYNRLSRLDDTQRQAGVVAWSSGNHAQGVAAAAKRLGIRATIVMPADAPANKLANTRRLGAEVVTYDRFNESREAIAAGIAEERGAVRVPPFDDPYIMAGQGTVGLEIIEQSADLGVDLAAVLVCCGGGGLTAGVATAVKGLRPHIDVYCVEPQTFDDTARSLVAGTRQKVSPEARSICDALMSPSPGELTFPINQALLSGGLTVSEDEVKDAMRFAFQSMKLVIEPGGAVALAALLNDRLPVGDSHVAIVVSGANADAELYAAILRGEV
ncbi:MAG: L-threo-3-hydroxyaspartate ammonia-lyase [Luteibacter sp.]|uniref:threonine ammonia-lyase n=1 Tax=Luteibacter sp. TaxID=1886636 RepID=UPI00137F6561|nr:threonine/serine dehydratase [Luteibacter sp.]KAF1007311.1 MAG: L-threo-3-hydroxyaspartate ammonia-lyase [Luteibacter sp.]